MRMQNDSSITLFSSLHSHSFSPHRAVPSSLLFSSHGARLHEVHRQALQVRSKIKEQFRDQFSDSYFRSIDKKPPPRELNEGEVSAESTVLWVYCSLETRILYFVVWSLIFDSQERQCSATTTRWASSRPGHSLWDRNEMWVTPQRSKIKYRELNFAFKIPDPKSRDQRSEIIFQKRRLFLARCLSLYYSSFLHDRSLLIDILVEPSTVALWYCNRLSSQD